jgi:hypothetical protein
MQYSIEKEVQEEVRADYKGNGIWSYDKGLRRWYSPTGYTLWMRTMVRRNAKREKRKYSLGKVAGQM